MLFAAHLWAQDPFQVHGYLQGQFTDHAGSPQRLEIRRARVSISGDPLSQLAYRLQADVAHSPYLMDASLTWTFSPAVRLTGGQFKIPFSAESLASSNLVIPIERARAVNSLAPGRDEGVSARDTGLEFSGALGRIEYAAAALSGRLIANTPAVRYRAVAGRLLFHPANGLIFGADWYGSFSSSSGPPKRRVEAEGNYDHGRLHLAAEQIFARDGSLHRRGGYLLGSWLVSPHWEPLTRIDWITADTHKSDATTVASLAGLNFHWGSHIKVGVNAGAQHDPRPRGFSSLFLAQTTLSF